MPQVPQRQYAEIISDLEAFDAYLTSLRLRGAPHRLRRMIAKLREIEKARVQGTLASLQARPDLPELVWSAVEALEFANIFQGIRDYDAATLKSLMQKALKGPLHPLQETSDRSNLGRNTTFELHLGAAFRRAGASIALGQRADLRLDHGGAHVYVECKRPFSEHGIRQNITRARTQLKQRFSSDPHPVTLGLVAISVSKALNPGSNMFLVDDAQSLRSLTNEVQRIHKLYGSDYDRLVDLRLIGILYHVFTPALVKTSGLVAASHFEIFLHTPSMQINFPISNGQPLKDVLLRAVRGSNA
jgi:hypothetical protein